MMCDFDVNGRAESTSNRDMAMLIVKTRETTSTGETAEIPLTHGKVAIVDAELYKELSKYNWTAKQAYGAWYAVRRVCKDHGDFTIYMHRQIMETPRGLLCHHKDRNSLDNRRAKLQNVTREQHGYIHKYNFHHV